VRGKKKTDEGVIFNAMLLFLHRLQRVRCVEAHTDEVVIHLPVRALYVIELFVLFAQRAEPGPELVVD
jgi:hypothetical protein